ncbi:MAG: metallophosphoesterase [Prochloraceae cyanobacterium]|nr:metallophosphoesterase [Prochloraceae cyanobacterium]
MRITSISEVPIEQIPFICASSNNLGVAYSSLQVIIAQVDTLPEGIDAIIATSDLQGVDVKSGRLLGHRVAEVLEILADRGTIPPKEATGIILAGDLWAQTDRRGGEGDVREVWGAMASRFRWVAGVGGNHDRFGDSPQDLEKFKATSNIYYLDGEIAEVDGMRLAGISGIIGKPSKPRRRTEKDFIKLIRQLVKSSPDILILHEGPNDADGRLMGRESIRKALVRARDLVIICGHCHWKVPIAILPKRSSIVNVDGRAIVFKARRQY